MKKIILAQWILPITQPPIYKGAILVNGEKIVTVGQAKDILKEPHTSVKDLGSVILLPGLVNAHTHLEYSCLLGKIPPMKKFTDWIIEMILQKRQLSSPQIMEGIQKGISELTKCGTTLVGDVTNTGLAAKALNEAHLCGSIFFELLGSGSLVDYFGMEMKLEKDAPDFKISPACHAPHTVSASLLKDMGSYLKKSNKKTSIHLAESIEESEWIRDQTGPFSQIFVDHSLLHNPGFGNGYGSLGYLHKHKFLTANVLCVHCVHTALTELKHLKKARSYVALCPRSNLYTGSGTAPVKDLLRSGIPLCLGTDSLASNTDLNLWNEMKTLRKIFPFLSYPSILQMATLNGAEALGYGRTHGSIDPGKSCEWITIPTNTNKVKNPYRFLWEESYEKVDRYPAIT